MQTASFRSNSRPFRALRLLGFVIGIGAAVLAWGTAEDDYRKGASAYHSGDVISGMGLLRKAADQGHAGAQALLGEILDRAEFNDEAVAYFRKSAEQGNADGQYGLGVMYLTGEGVAKDPKQALSWFKRAAATNHVEAVRAAAQIYLSTLTGPGANGALDAEGLQLVRQAAGLGHLPAIDALARGYRTGDMGFSADGAQADRWEARAKELRKSAGDRKKKR